MNPKNVLNENFNSGFDERVFVFSYTKNVIMFLRKLINYNTNRVIIIRIEKVDNKIYEHVLSSFDEHEKEY